MKRFLAFLLSAACMCSCTAFAAADVGTAKIGSGANIVTVSMHTGVTADVALAQGSISKDQTASEIIRSASDKGTLIAAVNGGFFNAYYDRQSEDGYGKAPRCQINLIKDGRVINGGAGDQTAVYLGFTSDGRALIDEVGVTLYVEHGGKQYPTWGVNNYYQEHNSMLLFTPEAGADLPVPANAKAAKIVGGKVTEILDSGKCVCAPDTYYFVCGKSLLDRLPAVGASVTFSTEFDKSAWNDVVTAVSCGPWLLHNGKNVFSENAKYEYLAAQKVSETAVAQRTFAAILSNGDLMLGTCSASPRQVTDYLLSIGATDAMLLDGGASSMLYANGKTLTSAGRKLNNVIAIYDSAQNTPVTPAKPAGPDVTLTKQNLTVDGEAKNAEIYNIGGSNYFKLRDMAALLNGTGSQFSVDYDAARSTIVVKTGAAYTLAKGDLKIGADKSSTAVASKQSIEIDGQKADLKAYNIGGNNFFKLRDLGKALGFDVDYDGATATMIVKSK